MSSFTITNNTKLPIHAATSWNGIVQEFQNNIMPGKSITLPSASFFGWQDVMVVTGFKENEISHAQDWKHALGLGILIAGSCVTVAAGVVAVATFGAATPLVAGSVTATLAVAGLVVGGAGVAVTGTDGVLKVVEYITHPPTIIKGLWGPDGGTIVVSGGDIIGNIDSTTAKFTVTGASPLKVERI